MDIVFSKMHGLGNDFVVIDGVNQTIDLDEAQRRLIADRHLGIGCDQILLLESSDDTHYDFVYRIFNADGSEVEQCGNGARCITRFAIDNNLTTNKKLRFKTSKGSLSSELLPDGKVCVDMGIPLFDADALPFDITHADSVDGDNFADYQISVSDIKVMFSVASMGNPHAVTRVSNIDTAAVAEQGTLLGTHAAFPNGVNVGFMQVVGSGHIKLRVFERGAGETLACGTGACAAVALGRRHGLLAEKVTVELPGGRLDITWSGENSDSLFMTGPVTTVFNGKMTL